MPFSISAVIGAALAISQTNALSIGLLSDLHLNWLYDDLTAPECIVGRAEPTEVRAPMGRYDCDPPQVLIETMIDRMIDQFGVQDVILVTGDLNAHHTAMGTIDAPLDENATYSLLLSQHAGINQILTEKFPNSLIFPAFGNNDAKSIKSYGKKGLD